MKEKQIKGVNLGNWLVLEKWMHPDLFAGTTAEDEDELCRQLDRTELERRLKVHRDTYITKDDFVYIRSLGMNTIRIPVPHFIFGDHPEYGSLYVPCAKYLDKAFDWAEELNLKILIDVHTAPESQNGFDNGGISGVCKWAQSEDRIQYVLDVLEELAIRYGKRKGLWGIELLNEPVSEPMWQYVKSRYKPHDPKRAQGSDFIPLSVLKDFYERGYRAIRRHMGPEKAVVIHDGFRYDAWSDFMTGPEYENVVLDTHWYLGADAGSDLDPVDLVNIVLRDYRKRLDKGQKIRPVIIGEWSLCHDSIKDIPRSEREKNMLYRLVADMQLLVWEEAYGFFFWSYKLMSDVEGWDLKKAISRGWMPKRYDDCLE